MNEQWKTTVTIEAVGDITVSTVQLPPIWTGWETCLFWGRNSCAIEEYDTRDEAIAGHQKLSQPHEVARAVHNYQRLNA